MTATRSPAKFYAPLAIGAPEPTRALPVRLERMIHFVPPHNEKIRAKIKNIAGEVDVVLGNLEDAIPANEKAAARKGFIAIARETDVVMLPKVEGPWDIHYLDQLLAQLEAKHSVAKPILIHAILETAEGVKNVEAIGGASPGREG